MLFYGLSNVTSIENAGNLNLSGAKDISYMFSGMTSLKTIDTSGFDLSNVTDVNHLFDGDSALNGIDVSKWQTGSIKNFSNIFSNMSSLTDLDVSKWDTKSATNMSNMFDELKALTSLDVSNFDTSNVTNMQGMFSYDSNLSSLNMDKWDVSKVTSFTKMFFNDSSLSDLGSDIGSWNIESATSLDSMFEGDANLPSLDLTGWNTGSVTTMSAMFRNTGNKNAKLNLNLSGWDLSKVISLDSMFQNSNVTDLKIDNWDVRNVIKNGYFGMVTGLTHMFDSVTNLNTLDLSTWKMSGDNTVANYMFSNSDIQRLKLGSNDSFIPQTGKSVDLPSLDTTAPLTGMWVNVGTGTVDKPEASMKLSSADLMTKYSTLGGPDDEWVREGSVVDTSVTGSVTIKTNLGDKVVDNISGKIGDDVDVTVPDVAGYTPDKKTVSAHIDDGGTIKTDDFVTYTKKSSSSNNDSNHGSGGSNSGQSDSSHVEDIKLTVATYPKDGIVRLYNDDDKLVSNRALRQDSDWFTDKIKTEIVSGKQTQYYRVATHEWVKTSQVYVYDADSVIVTTNKAARLYDAHGKLVTNRELATNSSWKVDKKSSAIIDGVLMYRVATDEWVKASDVRAK